MSWRPRHEAHAIDRVRVMFPFKDPLTTKLLSSATAEVIGKAYKLGFDAVSPAESAVTTINIAVGEGAPRADSGVSTQNGTLLRRHVDGSRVEEVGFRDGAFGYVTSTYGRWQNLSNRLKEVIFPALQKVEAAADLGSIKLEYWDTFHYEGEAAEADVSGLLNEFDNSLPKDVLSGGSQWHSHIGWFESGELGPILINRNLDVTDRAIGEGKSVRALSIFTLVEQRGERGSVPIDQIADILSQLHNRSLRLFGSTLSESYREMIGINLDEYQ